ncbi:unnamed protein product [Psylliodes chrysocephalus]|uniref:HAT C-terminal dimerisation domain-containing protein n=1 Tax=Psylliodes chrysocephalus TaxID=3402493 RepID=A0A9P0CY40_9CUCU|nr:unnamed protein product [Psylliodes chrysocephala]
MKKVFLKAPLRVQIYEEKLPGVPLPPKPVITRWGTWLEAVFFYFEHCDEIQLVMSEFNDNISEAIREAKKILKNPKLKQQLAYINGNYKLIVSTITLLERQEVNLCESVKLVGNLKSKIKSAPGSNGQLIFKKMKDVFNKNEGFLFLSNVAKILNGTFSEELQIQPDLLSALKYAPITSVEEERSFSMYKLILSDRRQSGYNV